MGPTDRGREAGLNGRRTPPSGLHGTLLTLGALRRARRWIGVAALLLGLGADGAVAQEGPEGLAIYTVQPGDTLARLALQATGDALRFEELIQYNQSTLADPNVVEVGMRLRVPPGWSLPGATVPAGETPASPPPPEPDTYRPGLETVERGGQTRPSGDRGPVPYEPGEVVSDATLEATTIPDANPWERLTFLPELQQLDREFDTLMMRAAYVGDVEWGAQRLAERKSAEMDRVEQEVLLAETTFDQATAVYDECREAAYRAERLLRKFEKYSDSELQRKELDVIGRLEKALRAEDKLWGEFWRDVGPATRELYTAMVEAMMSGEFAAAYELHARLKPHRLQLLEGDLQLTVEERDLLSGYTVGQILREIRELMGDDVYRVEAIHRKRMQEALQAQRRLFDCEREYKSAEFHLKQARQKRIQLSASLGQASGDALELEAKRLADRFGAILGEVQIVDAFLDNATWAGLWWKSGVSMRLAGQHDLGAKRLAQAAAVADDHRLPSGQVPPSLETWLREGENEVIRKRHGTVRVNLPVEATLTIDGLELEHSLGVAEVQLAPGIHRFVFWLDGSYPLMRLVGVIEGEIHEFTWYETLQLDGEQQAVIGEEVTLPVLPPEEGPKRWHFGVAAHGGLTLGRPVVGAQAAVRYLPRGIGGEVGLAGLVPTSPFWLTAGEEMVAFVRAHGAVLGRVDLGRFRFVGGAGGYVDPLLGAGPAGVVEFGYGLKDDLHLALTVRGGYDLTPHVDGIPRYDIGGALGVWF